MKRNKRLLATNSLIFLSALTTSTHVTYAEENETKLVLEEIIVTARQRAESLQDVPASITALTSDVIQSASIQRAEDFIGLTPGVTLVDAAEVGDTQVNIRGINGARDAENSFAFIVDGILMTNPAALNREFANLQQIEILKGPQGALYGRNAAAGAIIVTTRQPGDELAGNFKATAANNNSYYASGTLSGPVLEDKLGFVLHGDFRTTDGFYKNTFVNRKNTDDFENYNITARLVWDNGDNTTVDTKIRYGEVEASAITFNAAFAFPAFTGFSPEWFEDVNDHEFVFQGNVEPINEQDAFELSVKVDHEMNWATLTAWFLYSDIDQDLIADGTSGAFGFFNAEPNCRASTAALNAAGVVLPPPQVLGTVPDSLFVVGPGGSVFGPYTPTTCDGYQYQLRNQDDISLELRLTSPSDQDLRWIAGAYFLDLNREVAVATGIDTGEPIIGRPFNGPDSSSPTEQLVHDRFDSQVYAVFGQLAYDVTEKIEASLALRYDREERQVKNLVPTDAVTQFIDFDGFPFDGGAPLNPGLDPALNPGGITDQSRTFEQLQPKISLTWDASDDVTLFASWGIGFKSGGFNNQGSKATIDAFINSLPGIGAPFPAVSVEDTFKKEKSSAFELGFKAKAWNGRVNIEGAGYYTEVDDMQFFEFYVGPFGLLRVVSNIDEVQITGFELGINARIVDELLLYGGFNYTDSEIKKNSVRPDTLGNKSPYTAEYTLNLGMQFDHPVADGYNFVARADWRLVGPTWFHTVQDQERPTGFGVPADYSLTRRDSYNLLNVRAGIETDNWSIAVFADNLTEEEYLEEAIPAPEFGGSFIHPADKRTIGVEATFSF
ncbi:TonB-dependent receptor [Luteithermobacter gelatinilyticus]|uniref:TonB-dependent receptor n=1 Tax=Luteithermobacter gelatinilyticus TaxID=2582913 RepID=UPI0011074785|nr:TonB-dependent receptor [Luteithermobacter gelatinilyticus]